jgi:hypothetical protein
MQSAFLGADVGLHKEAPLNPDEDYFKQGFLYFTFRKTYS